MKKIKVPTPEEHNFDINKLLFIDIITVTGEKSFEELQRKNFVLGKFFENSKFSFSDRFPEINANGIYPEGYVDFLYKNYAFYYPEFAKIVCISLGAIDKNGEIKITSFEGEEKDILLATRAVLDTAESKYTLCGHNIKSFHIPFLGKRYLINGLKPPALLPNYETKPWEIKAIDTRDVWNFGGFKSFSSLEIVANLLGMEIESKKEDTKNFCESNVKTVINIIKKLNANG